MPLDLLSFPFLQSRTSASSSSKAGDTYSPEGYLLKQMDTVPRGWTSCLQDLAVAVLLSPEANKILSHKSALYTNFTLTQGSLKSLGRPLLTLILGVDPPYLSSGPHPLTCETFPTLPPPHSPPPPPITSPATDSYLPSHFCSEILDLIVNPFAHILN